MSDSFTFENESSTHLTHSVVRDYPQYSKHIVNVNVKDARIKHKTVNDDKFVILNYTPTIDLEIYPGNEILIDTPHYYQSVIMRKTPDNMLLPLSIAPSTPLPLGTFLEQYSVCDNNIQVSLMNEGTLIQLFYDTTDGEWQIATTGAVGGYNRHYRTEYPGYRFQPQKTFREMFFDTLTQVSNFEDLYCDDDELKYDLHYDPTKTYYQTPLSSLPYIKTLNKSWCYSYIISHPSNPLVNVVVLPTITLVAVCEVRPISEERCCTDYLAVSIPQHMFAEMIPHEYRKIVRIQPLFEWRGQSLAEKTLNYVFTNDTTPGLMITNLQTGERAVWYNQLYAYAANLRGNHPNLQYQFFELRTFWRIDEFLLRFPVFTGLFTHFFHQYLNFTFSVYSTYVQYYIYKNRECIQNCRYKEHVFQIHQILKTFVHHNKMPNITHELVQQYFDGMTPGQLLQQVNNE